MYMEQSASYLDPQEFGVDIRIELLEESVGWNDTFLKDHW